MIVGVALALACALATNVAFLFKHRGAVLASPVRVRHPLQSAADLFRCPVHLRRVRFRDPKTGKTLVFLTNQTALPALAICDLYKSRWQVELFFKWIKQHLRIKQYHGTSENAVKTQIWIALSVYVLAAIVRKRLKLDVSLYTLMQVLSVRVFGKASIES